MHRKKYAIAKAAKNRVRIINILEKLGKRHPKMAQQLLKEYDRLKGF